MIENRVHRVGPEQIEWPFRGDPFFKTSGPNTHSRAHPIDPFPCYAHDRDLVIETAARIETLFPLEHPVDYFLTEYEELGRTNGFADKVDLYDTALGRWKHWEPTITLIGKRIPPHPSMTRYLVAHEYGHVAKWHVEKIRKIDSNKPITDLDAEYMQLRVGSHKEYGGGRWHGNVGELFANDFRILVCGLEEEFWPHPGFLRPEQVPEVCFFWEKVVAEERRAA